MAKIRINAKTAPLHLFMLVYDKFKDVEVRILKNGEVAEIVGPKETIIEVRKYLRMFKDLKILGR